MRIYEDDDYICKPIQGTVNLTLKKEHMKIINNSSCFLTMQVLFNKI